MKDILAITNQISDAILHDLGALIKKHSDENFYGLALVSDDNFSSFFIALNTDEALKKIIIEEEVNDKEDLAYYRWSPNEWQYMSYDLHNNQLDIVNKKIFDIQKSCSDQGLFLEYINFVPNLMLDLIKKIIPKIKLLLNERTIIIFMSKTDSSDTEEYEDNSAKILNEDDILINFLNRYK